MRKWFGRLHGGQLLMVLLPMYLLGFGMMWVGYNYSLSPTNLGFAAFYAVTPADSIAAAQRQGTLVFRLIGAGPYSGYSRCQ